MTEIKVSVRTTVNPTESREKVEEAVRNVLGDIVLQTPESGGLTILEWESISTQRTFHTLT